MVFSIVDPTGKSGGMPALAQQCPDQVIMYQWIDASTSEYETTQSVVRVTRVLLSFEIDWGGEAMRQGWRNERCQVRMPVCATHRSNPAQNAAGTRSAEYSQRDFLLRFWSFQKRRPAAGVMGS